LKREELWSTVVMTCSFRFVFSFGFFNFIVFLCFGGFSGLYFAKKLSNWIFWFERLLLRSFLYSS